MTTILPDTVTNSLRRTGALFFLNGFLFASWVVQIPSVQIGLHLKPASLSLLLFMVVLGNVVVLPVLPRLLREWGVSMTAVSSVMLMVLGMGLVPFMENVPGIALALLVYGMGFSGVDFTMNAAAAWLEEKAERPVMSSLHAGFSIGSLVGGVLGGVLFTAKVSMLAHLVGAGVLTLIAGTVAMNGLDPEVGQSGETEKPKYPPLSAALLIVLVAGFSAAICEGTVTDWAAVFLRRVHHVSASLASWGYSAFALMMVAGRLSGDWARTRFGDLTVSVFASVITVLGLSLASFVPVVTGVIVGLGLSGLGLSILAPLAFSAAWRLWNAAGVVLLSAVFYVGFLAGPPLAGLITHAGGISKVFWLPLVCVVLYAALTLSTRVYQDKELAS